MLKTAKAEQLHSAPKIITTPVKWYPVGENRYRLEVKVLVPELNEILTLVGNRGKKNHSFVLHYQGHPFRKYTKHFRHKSHSLSKVFQQQPHKHTWDEELEDDQAHIPNDIDPSASIDDQFLAFLKEENIRLEIEYQRTMF